MRFSGCKALEEVTVPDQVTVIQQDCFSGCESLKTVNLPASLMFIEPYAFSGCGALRSIHLDNPAPTQVSFGANAFLGVNTNTCTLYVPSASHQRYSVTVPWTIFKNIK